MAFLQSARATYETALCRAKQIATHYFLHKLNIGKYQFQPPQVAIALSGVRMLIVIVDIRMMATTQSSMGQHIKTM